MSQIRPPHWPASTSWPTWRWRGDDRYHIYKEYYGGGHHPNPKLSIVSAASIISIIYAILIVGWGLGFGGGVELLLGCYSMPSLEYMKKNPTNEHKRVEFSRRPEISLLSRRPFTHRHKCGAQVLCRPHTAKCGATTAKSVKSRRDIPTLARAFLEPAVVHTSQC